MEKTTSKDTGPQWVQRWQYHLPIFSWQRSKQKLISRSATKTLTWKRYIDDVFSLWNVAKMKSKLS